MATPTLMPLPMGIIEAGIQAFRLETMLLANEVKKSAGPTKKRTNMDIYFVGVAPGGLDTNPASTR
jgi:hypothetical protein